MDAVDVEARRARFEAVVLDLVDPLRRFLARRTDAATADDVLGDTLLVLWRRYDDLPDEVLPYAYGVARSCLANAQRGARRQGRVAGRIATLGPAAPRREPWRTRPPVDDRIGEALAALPPDDADLLRLWAWEQLTPGEIATVLEITLQRRQHPAAPRPEEAGRRGAKGRRRLPDMKESTDGRDTVNEYDDDSLLARLRAADPAASLPPAGPERVADLLEDVMSETTTRTTESRDTGTHDRSPLTWLVAAAAVLLILATGRLRARRPGP